MPDDPCEELRRAFWYFDKNLDRRLDRDELKIVLINRGEDEADISKYTCQKF